jgi:hypothetical protein
MCATTDASNLRFRRETGCCCSTLRRSDAQELAPGHNGIFLDNVALRVWKLRVQVSSSTVREFARRYRLHI